MQVKNLSQNGIYKRALLKDSNLQLIKKVETDYFIDSYGYFFNEFNDVQVSPLLRYESHLLTNFQK